MGFELSYVVDLETTMRVISESSYAGLTDNLWWQKICKTMTSESRKELVTWLLSSAKLEDLGKGGNIFFEEMSMIQQQAENTFAGAGLKLSTPQVMDLDGHGLDLAGQWSRDIAAQIAYWPQRRIAKLILAGETGIAYDGKPFFANNHPVNPGNPTGHTFTNLLIGDGTSSTVDYRIDDRVTLDSAYINFSKAVAVLQSIEDSSSSGTPRNLVPAFIMAPPRMRARVALLSNAKQIAMASAGGGGGSVDMTGSITQSLGEPIIVPEFSAALTGNPNDDFTFYIVAAEQESSAIGAFLYMEREAFEINYYTGAGGSGATPTGMDAVLNRADQLEYHAKGRNGVMYGHPFRVLKVRGAPT